MHAGQSDNTLRNVSDIPVHSRANTSQRPVRHTCSLGLYHTSSQPRIYTKNAHNHARHSSARLGYAPTRSSCQCGTRTVLDVITRITQAHPSPHQAHAHNQPQALGSPWFSPYYPRGPRRHKGITRTVLGRVAQTYPPHLHPNTINSHPNTVNDPAPAQPGTAHNTPVKHEHKYVHLFSLLTSTRSDWL